MKLLSVGPSTKADKKLMAKFETDTGRIKHVHFGAKGMDDYTKTHDREQRTRYRTRHAKNENWNDPTTPGALSRWILWGDSTSLQQNISSYKSRFHL
jgi:hypothetical protein